MGCQNEASPGGLLAGVGGGGGGACFQHAQTAVGMGPGVAAAGQGYGHFAEPWVGRPLGMNHPHDFGVYNEYVDGRPRMDIHYGRYV